MIIRSKPNFHKTVGIPSYDHIDGSSLNKELLTTHVPDCVLSTKHYEPLVTLKSKALNMYDIVLFNF